MFGRAMADRHGVGIIVSIDYHGASYDIQTPRLLCKHLTAAEAQLTTPSPCIRCGRCVDACPMGLMPLEMSKRARHDDLDGALAFGLIDCISCGSCAYACPSHIPLVQYFEYARGALEAQERAEQKSKETRRLLEQRQARLARAEQAKVEAAAKRLAEKQRAKAAKAGVGVAA